MNKVLQKKLITMVTRDQKMRRSGKWNKQIDIRNTAALQTFVKKYDWPDNRLVGRRGADAAWLIAQHADHTVAFQKKCLKLISDPVVRQFVSPSHIAYLTDRVRVNEGKKQIYGTQFYKTKNNRFVPRPIYDKQNLNGRRQAVGLKTFEKYQKELIALVGTMK